VSGLLRGIGKVFKKVVKTVVKIAPYALAAAAVVFTGGAALGVLPTFAGAVGSVVGSIGLSGAAAGALTGAITSAGFGAAAGGVLGGKKGLKQGALMGAVAGGALGAMSPAAFGFGQAAEVATGGLGAPPISSAVTGAGPIASPVGTGATATGGLLTQAGGGLATAAAPAASLVSTAPAATGIMGLLNSNPHLLPSVLQGVGGALGDSEGDIILRRDREEAERIGGNYAFQGDFAPVDQTVRPNPNERFSPGQYQSAAPTYRVNPKTGRVEAVYPVGGA
jgi:hypothetical protein